MKMHMLTAIGGSPTIAAGTVIERDTAVAVEWFMRGYAEPCDDAGRKAYQAEKKKETAAAVKAQKAAEKADQELAAELTAAEAENRPTKARRRTKERKETTTAPPAAERDAETTEE